MTKPKSPAERWAAESLFVREGKTCAEISERLGVTVGMVWRWSKQGHWVQRRRERLRESPQAALDVLKRERERMILKLTEKEHDPSAPGGNGNDQNMAGGKENHEGTLGEAEINALHKLSAVIEKMESHMEAIGPMLDAFERFAQFLVTHADADACEMMREWIEKFLEEERSRT